MFWLFLFSLLNLFCDLSAVSPDDLKSEYTLIVKVTDQRNRICVAAIPGKYLVQEEPIQLVKKHFIYGQEQWLEVCDMWHDMKSPKDTFITPQSIEPCCNSSVLYKLPLQKAEEVCFLQMDKNLTFQQAILVINDFIDECCMTKHKNLFDVVQESASSFSFDLYDIEFEEDEINKYTKSNPPSGLLVYARQIGVALLMRSMVLTRYINNKWGELKGYILS